MDEDLKHKIIETIEDTYIAEVHRKYTSFMRVKTIYLVHHIKDSYGKITETYLE